VKLCPACGSSDPSECVTCPLEQTMEAAKEAILRYAWEDRWLTPEDWYEAMCAMMAERAPA
jgi:hypothetical protein